MIFMDIAFGSCLWRSSLFRVCTEKFLEKEKNYECDDLFDYRKTILSFLNHLFENRLF